MAKITYRLDLRRKLTDNTYPLRIAVSNLRKTAYISTGHSFTEAGWKEAQKALTGRKHRNRTEAAIAETKQRLDLALTILQEREDISRMDAAKLRDRLMEMTRKGTAATERGRVGHVDVSGGDDPLLFLPYYLSKMEEKETEGTRMVYRRTYRLILRYMEHEKADPEALRFQDITPAWLLGFNNWMKDNNNEAASRSISMRNIKSVFNDAIDEEMAVDYPFSRSSSRRTKPNNGKRKFRIDKVMLRSDMALTSTQLRSIRDFPVAEHQKIYRDVFLLSVYLIGINAVDILTAKPEQLNNGYFEYVRRKTHQVYCVKVEPEAMEIIRRYRGERFLLSPCDGIRDYRYFLRRMNEQLKLIGITYHTRQNRTGKPICPKLSSNWGRHTWSTIAAMELGLSEYLVGKSLNHAWASGKVTDRYISKSAKAINYINRMVLDYLADPEGYKEKYKSQGAAAPPLDLL